jgi:F0F1-type ATP synthase beta subunit
VWCASAGDRPGVIDRSVLVYGQMNEPLGERHRRLRRFLT